MEFNNTDTYLFKGPFGDLASKWISENDDKEYNRMFGHHIRSYSAGYNKAKEKYKYTEEDIRKSINMARLGYDKLQIFAHLNKPKQYEVELEMIHLPIGQNSNVIGTNKEYPFTGLQNKFTTKSEPTITNNNLTIKSWKQK